MLLHASASVNPATSASSHRATAFAADGTTSIVITSSFAALRTWASEVCGPAPTATNAITRRTNLMEMAAGVATAMATG